jgi:hypothetical protein
MGRGELEFRGIVVKVRGSRPPRHSPQFATLGLQYFRQLKMGYQQVCVYEKRDKIRICLFNFF